MSLLFRFQSLFGLVIVFVLAMIFSPVRHGQLIFLDPGNLGNIVRAVSEIGILAVGMTFVILTGGIDLSVGAVLGVASVGTAILLTTENHGIVLTALVVLLIGLAFGGVQGALSQKLRIQAFIVTLAGLQVARGIARIWSGDQGIPITFGHGPKLAPPAFSVMTDSFLGGLLPVPALIFIGIGILGILVLRLTAFARHVYAVGSNEKAARLSGVPVDRIKIAVYAISGLLAAVAGIIHAGQLNQGGPNDGLGYELEAIAAVVIGGTSLFGGEGSMAGSLAGALFLGVLENILELRGVNADLQLIVTGLVIVAAVALQRLRPAGADH
ncbi:MAG: ABC transporter permease [Marmoricola sp.]